MANEEDIKTLMAEINGSLLAINSKPALNMKTLITSLVTTVIIGAFAFYVGMVKFTSTITHSVDDNTKDIKEIKSKMVTKTMLNSHIELENINMSTIDKKLNLDLTKDEKLKTNEQ